MPAAAMSLDVANLPPLWRCADATTSHAAGAAVGSRLSDLQAVVLELLERHGAMTAKEAERLERFAALAPSTVRKRVSELARAGALTRTGAVRDRCAEYRATGPTEETTPC